MFTINNISKYYRNCIIAFIVSVFAAVAMILLIIFAFTHASKQINAPIPFESIVSDKKAKGSVAYVDIIKEPVKAISIKKRAYRYRNYYVVNDGKSNYAVIMSASNADKIAQEVLNNGSARITCVTAALSDKTITGINNAIPECIDSAQALELHFLPHPDTFSVVMDDHISYPLYISVFATALIAGIVSLVYIFSFSFVGIDAYKKQQLKEELNSPDAVWLENINCCICDNWLVGIGKGLNAIEYTDIAELYVKKNYSNGFAISGELDARKKDGKTITISLYAVSFIKQSKYAEIDSELKAVFQKAHEKNKNIGKI